MTQQQKLTQGGDGLSPGSSAARGAAACAIHTAMAADACPAPRRGRAPPRMGGVRQEPPLKNRDYSNFKRFEGLCGPDAAELAWNSAPREYSLRHERYLRMHTRQDNCADPDEDRVLKLRGDWLVRLEAPYDVRRSTCRQALTLR